MDLALRPATCNVLVSVKVVKKQKLVVAHEKGNAYHEAQTASSENGRNCGNKSSTPGGGPEIEEMYVAKTEKEGVTADTAADHSSISLKGALDSATSDDRSEIYAVLDYVIHPGRADALNSDFVCRR